MIGTLRFNLADGPVEVQLTDDLHWSSPRRDVADYLQQVCPTDDRCGRGLDARRHVLFAAAQRLGAKVELPHRHALA